MVISTVNQVVYNGDGVTTAWPFTFRIIEATDIKLLLIDADGTETDITSDYYVDTVNDTVYYPGYAPGAEPPAEDQPPKVQSGQKLVVYRELPITQEKDLGDKWPFHVIELGLDKLTMILQQIFGWWDRCLKVSVGQSVDNPDTVVPLEAGKVIVGNADGNGYEAAKAMLMHNGEWGAEGNIIENVGYPVDNEDATNKGYVDAVVAAIVHDDGILFSFNNVAEMRSAELVPNVYALTGGYYSPNDDGAGVYYIRAAAPGDVDDAGSIIVLDNGNVAELIENGVINIKQFGAKGDGLADDTAAIRRAIAAAKKNTPSAKIIFPSGTYNISDTLEFYWFSPLSLDLGNAQIKATTNMGAMIHCDHNWTYGNEVKGGTIDMNNMASIGLQINKNNRPNNINNITITNVGNGKGLVLGDNTTTVSSDGSANVIGDIKIIGTLENEDTYNGIGFYTTLGDMYVHDLLIYHCKKGAVIYAGGTSYQNVHIWHNVPPSNAAWEDFLAIEDFASSNVYSYVYFDNYKTGLLSHDSGYAKKITLNNLFYFLPLSTDTPKTVNVISTGYQSIVDIDNVIMPDSRNNYTINIIHIKNTDLLWKYLYLIQNQGIRVEKNPILSSDGFNVINEAFNICADDRTMHALTEQFAADTVPAGYYLLGYMPDVNGFLTLNVGERGTMSAELTIKLTRSGTPIITDAKFAGDESGYELCFGSRFTTDMYGEVNFFPVYLHKLTSTTNGSFQVGTQNNVSSAFYAIKKPTVAELLVPSPSILYNLPMKNTNEYPIETGSKYIKYASGLLMVWGSVSVTASQDYPVTFPVAFIDTNYAITIGRDWAYNWNEEYYIKDKTKNGFSLKPIGTVGTNDHAYMYTAIGKWK